MIYELVLIYSFSAGWFFVMVALLFLLAPDDDDGEPAPEGLWGALLPLALVLGLLSWLLT